MESDESDPPSSEKKRLPTDGGVFGGSSVQVGFRRVVSREMAAGCGPMLGKRARTEIEGRKGVTWGGEQDGS